MSLNIFHGILLGILQGIFEWLPISSEGQIIIFSVLFFEMEAQDALVLSIFLHLGTLLAAITYFRKRLYYLIKNLPNFFKGERNDQTKLIRYLVISTIFTILVGVPIYFLVKSIISDLSGIFITLIIGTILILFGFILKKIPKTEFRGNNDTKASDATSVGALTGLSAIPGVSRSGISVLALLIRQFRAEDALILSFLMSIPTILAAEIGIALIEGFNFISIEVLMVALIFSYISGLLTIKVLLDLTKKVKPYVFSFIFGLFAISMGFILVLVEVVV